MKLAIFDLDNTLLCGDSDHTWGEFLVAKGLVNRAEYGEKNDYFFQQYQNGTLDIVAYLEFSAEPLRNVNKLTRDQWHEEFMQETIEPLLLPKAMNLVSEHKKSGHYCLVITATNRFIAEPIANRFQVDAIIASEFECKDNFYTGKVSGVPCYKEGKITRLCEWLTNCELNLTLQDSVFYSDSSNDIPLLEEVSEAVAVDPDDTLRQYALARGWKVMSLR